MLKVEEHMGSEIPVGFILSNLEFSDICGFCSDNFDVLEIFIDGTKVNRFLVVAPELPQIKNLSQIQFSNGNPPPFCTLHTILSKK
jgi:hypothetical protein